MAEDRRLFEARPKAAFPDIRFVVAPRFRKDEERRIVYLDSTLDPRAEHVELRAWLQPEDWHPEWMESQIDKNVLVCSNLPDCCFYFTAPGKPQTHYILRPLMQNPEREVWARAKFLGHAPIYGHWRESQPETRRFLQQVLRLAKKDATNEIMGIDFATGRPFAKTRPAKGGGLIWIGQAAAEWLRGQPNRFIGHFRLREEFETYHWPLPEADESEGDESAGCLRTER